MRVLHVTIDFPPPRRGGLDRQVQELAESIISYAQVGIVALNSSYTYDGIAVYGAREIYDALPERELSHLARANLAIGHVLTAELVGNQWDIVHFHDWMLAPVASMMRSTTFSRPPMLASMHANAGTPTIGSTESLSRRLEWESKLLNSMDTAVVCSDWLHHEVLIRHPSAKINKIPNGIKSDLFKPASTTQNFKSRLLFVGRLVPYKGCQDLIRAIAIAKPCCHDLQLDIVGDGYFRHELETLVDTLGLNENIVFHGWKDDMQLVELYSQALITVIPSHEEAFGLTLIEAMACGSPVLVSNISALQEKVTVLGEGSVFEVGSCTDLAHSLCHLLSNPSALEKRSRNGINYVRENYDWGTIGPQFRSLYESLVANFKLDPEMHA